MRSIIGFVARKFSVFNSMYVLLVKRRKAVTHQTIRHPKRQIHCNPSVNRELILKSSLSKFVENPSILLN